MLGGDHPLGLPLIIELEQKGYIVITSVSTPEAVSNIEIKGHGYVRALVLDPNEVCITSGHPLQAYLTEIQLAWHYPYLSPVSCIYFVPTFSYHSRW